MENNFLIGNDVIQETKNNTIAENMSCHNNEYKLVGFEINEIKVTDNSIILCYSDYRVLKEVYNKLLGKIYHYHVRMKVVVAPLEQYPFNIVIEFINRNKDCYCAGHIPKDIESDEVREMKFLSNVDKFDKIIYIGDVIKLYK